MKETLSIFVNAISHATDEQLSATEHNLLHLAEERFHPWFAVKVGEILSAQLFAIQEERARRSATMSQAPK